MKRPAIAMRRPAAAIKRPAVVTSLGVAKAVPRKVEVQGHRGYGHAEPHNTLRAFLAAAAHPGVDSVEFDVQMSADGHLVVTHGEEDAGPGAISSQPLSEIQAQDLGHGQRVPVLAHVIDVCLSGKLIMNVELKTADPNAIEATLSLLRTKGALPYCRISSFDRSTLTHVMRIAPEVPVGALYNPRRSPNGPIAATPEDFASWFKDHECERDSVNLRSETVTAEEMAAAKRCGKQVLVWFACKQDPGFEETLHEYRRIISLGADVVCCNRLDVLTELVKKEGLSCSGTRGA